LVGETLFQGELTIPPEAIDKADIILVMAPVHKEAILRMAPRTKNKIFYLREFEKKSSLNKIVPDPIGRPVEFYRTVLDIIKKSLDGFLKWLES